MKIFLLENQQNMKKLYKAKMKDRHKLKGIKLNYPKKEVKKYLLSSNEKSQEKLIKEYEVNLLFKNYNKLKHDIFIREQKEKELTKQEEINKYSSKAFNYTNLTKLIEKFISLKKDKSKDNPFNYNLNRGKMIIDQMNRNIKINRINDTLKKIVLHYTKIKPKLNTRNSIINTFLSDEAVEKIKNKIEYNRKKINKRNYISRKNNSVNLDTKCNNDKFSYYNTTNNSNLIMNNEVKKQMIDITNNNESTINKNIMNYNLKYSTFRSSLNKNIKLKKKKYSSSSLQIYSNVFNLEEQNKKNQYNKNRINSFNKNGQRILQSDNTIEKNKKLILNSSNLTRYTNLSLNVKQNKYKKKSTWNHSELSTEDYNTIGLIKKCNSNYVKKNYSKTNLSYRPQSCMSNKNKNMLKYNLNDISINKQIHKRNYSSNKKKSFLKVKNMPIYSTNISDFIVEFNRIKKNIKKLKKNYEEKHFSTYKEIDHILEIKEDMMMFLLKQKYFNSKFKPIQKKLKNNKKEFITKMKNDFEILEEKPLSINFRFDDFKFD